MANARNEAKKRTKARKRRQVAALNFWIAHLSLYDTVNSMRLARQRDWMEVGARLCGERASDTFDPAYLNDVKSLQSTIRRYVEAMTQATTSTLDGGQRK